MIHLGFEVGSGAPVAIPPAHTIFIGQSSRAGKTTALEALAVRSRRPCLAFLTKPGEQSFRAEVVNEIPPYYSEDDYDWQTVRLICEAMTGGKMTGDRLEFARVITEDGQIGRAGKPSFYAWKRPRNVLETIRIIDDLIPRASGRMWSALLAMRGDLRNAERKLAQMKTKAAGSVYLERGLNVVDLERYERHIQAMVISSMIRWCRENSRNTIIALPEVWKFADSRKQTAVGEAAALMIREGAAKGNFVWIDSQRLLGLNRELLSQVRVWLFGVQRDSREIREVLTAIPGNRPEPEDVAHLQLGHFIACWDEEIVHVYVQPYGVNDITSEAIARGDERPETAKAILASM